MSESEIKTLNHRLLWARKKLGVNDLTLSDCIEAKQTELESLMPQVNALKKGPAVVNRTTREASTGPFKDGNPCEYCKDVRVGPRQYFCKSCKADEKAGKIKLPRVRAGGSKTFKQKKCSEMGCENIFIPQSGSQKKCKSCRAPKKSINNQKEKEVMPNKSMTMRTDREKIIIVRNIQAELDGTDTPMKSVITNNGIAVSQYYAWKKKFGMDKTTNNTKPTKPVDQVPVHDLASLSDDAIQVLHNRHIEAALNAKRELLNRQIKSLDATYQKI